MSGGSGSGRKRIDDRRTLQGVLFVLHTGIQWEYLPQESRFNSGPTCWRRLAKWQEVGVREELQRVLLDRLRSVGPPGLLPRHRRRLARAGQTRAKHPKSRPEPG